MKWKQLGSKCEKSEEENESLSESESSDKAKKNLAALEQVSVFGYDRLSGLKARPH